MTGTQDTVPQVSELLSRARQILSHFLRDAGHNPASAWKSVSELQELSRQLRRLRPDFRRCAPVLPFRAPFTPAEQVALLRARLCGWLEVTPAVGEIALQHWQQLCECKRKPFAVSRPETTRTSIWLVLPEGDCWTPVQGELLEHLRASVKAIVWDEHSLRALVPPGREKLLFSRLLSLEPAVRYPADNCSYEGHHARANP